MIKGSLHNSVVEVKSTYIAGEVWIDPLIT